MFLLTWTDCTVSTHQLQQILARGGGFERLLAQLGAQIQRGGRGADDDDEVDDDYGYGHYRRRRRQRTSFHGDRYPPIPSETGQKLMASGTFGANDHSQRTACGYRLTDETQRKRKRLATRILDRELGLESRGRSKALNGLMSQDMIPKTKADLVVHFQKRCFSGQFSEDGSFFFACGQDFKVRMYDTSNPYDWKYYKTVDYMGGSWTLTDASLSPDNKLLAYSSIANRVCLANTEQGDQSEPLYLDFRDTSREVRSRHHHSHVGIWSLRFSGDGTEIVAGTNVNSVCVYDLETRKTILMIPGHEADVNAVCFGDRMSPHILYSGSDDTTLKVWDRRSLASMRPAGMFLGHTEGLTYIDSKGDGRYVISNGKDQTCKLWDLRKMINTDEGEKIYAEVCPKMSRTFVESDD
jgi:WD repeat-containing protein 23